jgi:toxin-antitoxin system PIN domain toxin
MLLLDANILLYAVNRDAVHHKKSKLWLETQISGTETVGLSWNVVLAFLRLTTRPGLFRHPLEIDTALSVVSDWLSADGVTMLQPGPRHFEILADLLRSAGTGGNLTSDAHLAAIAIEHGATLCSFDSDFKRFPRLRWQNPLN